MLSHRRFSPLLLAPGPPVARILCSYTTAQPVLLLPLVVLSLSAAPLPPFKIVRSRARLLKCHTLPPLVEDLDLLVEALPRRLLYSTLPGLRAQVFSIPVSMAT